MEPTVSARRPYWRDTISSNVVQPLLRSGRAYTSANSEPPSRDAETESQLSGAYGGLSTHQGTENGSTHHPRARATARSETLGVFHLATGKNADGQKQSNRQQDAYNVYRCHHTSYRKSGCKGTFFL